MYKCKKCNKEFDNYDGLRRHSGRIHKIESGKFYCDFYLSGNWPTCKCECGEKVNWYKGSFRMYKGNHEAIIRLKINNPWGHNKNALAKSLETRRKRFKNGEIIPWARGKTAKTDDRLKRLGESVSKSFTDDRKEKMSYLMSKNRKGDIIPTLFGPDSSQWKGGTSEVNNIARSNKRLYDEWKYPILIRDSFKCVECGNSKKLHIHHDKEKFCEIVEKHMPDVDEITDFVLKKSIAEKIVDYHIKNKVSGITLCDKCHEKYHPSLNFG